MNRVRLCALAKPFVAGALISAAVPAVAQDTLKCEPGETYVMNVMISSHPYWVPVYQGFKQAATAFEENADSFDLNTYMDGRDPS